MQQCLDTPKELVAQVQYLWKRVTGNRARHRSRSCMLCDEYKLLCIVIVMSYGVQAWGRGVLVLSPSHGQPGAAKSCSDLMHMHVRRLSADVCV